MVQNCLDVEFVSMDICLHFYQILLPSHSFQVLIVIDRALAILLLLSAKFESLISVCHAEPSNVSWASFTDRQVRFVDNLLRTFFLACVGPRR